MTTWVVIGVLAVVGLWAMSVYNRLVELRNRIANAFGQIDVQLKRRYDLIPNLVEVARGYLQHEASTLEAVIQARGQAQGAAAAARVALAGKERCAGCRTRRWFRCALRVRARPATHGATPAGQRCRAA